MKKTLIQIGETISSKTDEMKANGRLEEANLLNRDYIYFVNGYLAGLQMVSETINSYNVDIPQNIWSIINSNETEFEIPANWENYFIDGDPDYLEYLRLKEKFSK